MVESLRDFLAYYRNSQPCGGTIYFKGLAEIRWAFCVSGVPSGFQIFVCGILSIISCSSDVETISKASLAFLT